MVPGRSSRAIAVIVSLWVLACAAALALATTGDQAAAQGCSGGGSPSPSGSGGSPPASDDPLPTLPVTIPPAPDAKEAVHPAEDDPTKKVQVGGTAQEATAQQSCKSTVTIAYESGKNPKFTGKVGSDEAMCKRARDVTVKKLKRGNDPTVGKAVTNAKGKYTVPARQANGRFYAKVARSTVENDDGETITCGAARSKAIRP